MTESCDYVCVVTLVVISPSPPPHTHTLSLSLSLPLQTKDSDDSGLGETQPNSAVATPKGFHVPEIDAEEYKAIDFYEAEGAGQVSFEAGQTIQVLDKMEDGTLATSSLNTMYSQWIHIL